VKRVVGVPGDTIEVKDGDVFVNGAAVPEQSYVPETNAELPVDQRNHEYRFQIEQLGDHAHVTARLNGRGNSQARNFGPFTLKHKGQDGAEEDQYFMMGDNRDNSKDSRFFKQHYVNRDQILGRANRVIFSLDYNDSYLPRKNRFFHALK
jgi:signal peptidase I